MSKLDRVKNIARSSLVTLPKFVQDQVKYKAMLRQIGRLNGILPDDAHPAPGLKQTTRRRRTKSLSPRKRRTKPKLASTRKEAAGALAARKQEQTGSSTRKMLRQQPTTSPPHKPNHPTPPPPPLHSSVPNKNGSGILASPVHDSISSHHPRLARLVPSNERSTRSTENIGGTRQDDRACLFQPSEVKVLAGSEIRVVSRSDHTHAPGQSRR